MGGRERLKRMQLDEAHARLATETVAQDLP
jgi:hypothetical protein